MPTKVIFFYTLGSKKRIVAKQKNNKREPVYVSVWRKTKQTNETDTESLKNK